MTWRPDPNRIAVLTDAEVRLVSMVARGMLDKQIAREVKRSEACVRKWLGVVRTKVAADAPGNARVAITRFAVAACIVPTYAEAG